MKGRRCAQNEMNRANTFKLLSKIENPLLMVGVRKREHDRREKKENRK